MKAQINFGELGGGGSEKVYTALIPTTSNSAQGGSFANSYYSASYLPWKAFDEIGNSMQDVHIPVANEAISAYYLGYELSSAQVATFMTVIGTSANATYYYDVVLKGANQQDLSDAVTLSEPIRIQSASLQKFAVSFKNTTAYKYYFLAISASNGASAHVSNTYALEIANIQVYGEQ